VSYSLNKLMRVGTLTLAYQLVLILLVSVILVGIILVTPTAKGLSACYTQGIINYKQESIKAAREEWGDEKICLYRKNVLDSINLCFEEVEKSGSIPLAVELAKFISPRTRQLLDFKTTHNSACAAYPDSLVD
jgi:hypothetical protein